MAMDLDRPLARAEDIGDLLVEEGWVSSNIRECSQKFTPRHE
jgi:hypothetical protein